MNDDNYRDSEERAPNSSGLGTFIDGKAVEKVWEELPDLDLDLDLEVEVEVDESAVPATNRINRDTGEPVPGVHTGRMRGSRR